MKVISAEFVKGAVHPSAFPNDLPEFAVAGRSNVGKSAFINFLCGRKKLVSTSKTPGKTRELNFFLVNRRYYLVDIPGFGFAKLNKKKRRDILRQIESYFLHSKRILGIIYLLDIRRIESLVDRQFIEWLSQFSHPMLMVATKADKLKKSRIHDAVNALEREYKLPVPPIFTSSLQKIGRSEVLAQLEEILQQKNPI